MSMRSLKRRHDVLTLRDAVNGTEWMRRHHRQTVHLSWQMRQKWKDAPRCTVLRGDAPARRGESETP